MILLMPDVLYSGSMIWISENDRFAYGVVSTWGISASAVTGESHGAKSMSERVSFEVKHDQELWKADGSGELVPSWTRMYRESNA